MIELQELIKELELQLNYSCYDAQVLEKTKNVWVVVQKLVDILPQLQQTPCTAMCHIVNECGIEHTQVAKVFRDKQAAIDYAVEMNGHAEKLKLNTEYRLFSLPLA